MDLDKAIIQVLKDKAREGKSASKKDIMKELEIMRVKGSPKTVGEHLRNLVNDERSGVIGEKPYYRDIEDKDTKIKDQQEVFRAYKYINEIGDDELRYLIDTVLHSKVVETKQGRELIKKLQNLSGKTLRDDTSYIGNVHEAIYTDNENTLKNVQLLQDAIRHNKKVRFMFNGYNLEKKLYPYWSDIQERHPYQIVLSNGRYYLMATDDQGLQDEKYRLYRVDLLTNVEIVDTYTNCRQVFSRKYDDKDLIKLTRERPYMFAGNTERITLRVEKAILVQIVDWFGKDFEIIKGSETIKGNLKKGTIDIVVYANKESMLYWVLQYSKSVEVLAPEAFRKGVKETLEEIMKKYSD